GLIAYFHNTSRTKAAEQNTRKMQQMVFADVMAPKVVTPSPVENVAKPLNVPTIAPATAPAVPFSTNTGASLLQPTTRPAQFVSAPSPAPHGTPAPSAPASTDAIADGKA